MNPCLENAEVTITVLPDCPACAEMAAAPVDLKIEYGPGPLEACYGPWLEQQRTIDEQCRQVIKARDL